MKKIVLIFVTIILILVGCKKDSEEKIETEDSSIINKIVENEYNYGVYEYQTKDLENDEIITKELTGYDSENNIEFSVHENFITDHRDLSIFKKNYRCIANLNEGIYYEDKGYKESILNKISGFFTGILHGYDDSTNSLLEERISYSDGYKIEKDGQNIVFAFSDDTYMIYDRDYDLIEEKSISEGKEIKIILVSKSTDVNKKLEELEDELNRMTKVDNLEEVK